MKMVQRIILVTAAAVLVVLGTRLYAQTDTPTTEKERQALMQELIAREKIAAEERAAAGPAVNSDEDWLMKTKEKDRAGMMAREEESAEGEYSGWGWY